MSKQNDMVRHLIDQKRELEADVRALLNDFRDKTGLCVENIYLEPLETTNMDDAYRWYGDYQVMVRLDLP